MRYEYKVLHESDFRNLEPKLNKLGEDGWKLVSICWSNDESLLIVTMSKEK